MNKEFPHTDIYDNNLTLINVTNFKFVINNDICNVQRVALVTIIYTQQLVITRPGLLSGQKIRMLDF